MLQVMIARQSFESVRDNIPMAFGELRLQGTCCGNAASRWRDVSILCVETVQSGLAEPFLAGAALVCTLIAIFFMVVRCFSCVPASSKEKIGALFCYQCI